MKKKLLTGLAMGFLMFGMVGFANASTIISQVGTPAVTGSDGSGTLTNGWLEESEDFGWTHSYASITGNIISATLTIDIIDADNGHLNLYGGTNNSGLFIGGAYGNDNGDGTRGEWQGLGDNTIETTFILQSDLFNDLADGTFDVFGDSINMHAWGSNHALLSIEVNPVPLPSAILLLGSGLAGLAGTIIRRKTK